MKQRNILTDIPDELSDEVFEILEQNSNVRIERIVSKGHASPATGWYDQKQNEWVIVLQGNATISFEDGTAVSLRTGDYVHIKAHKKHKVTRTSSDPVTVWLAIHY